MYEKYIKQLFLMLDDFYNLSMSLGFLSSILVIQDGTFTED